MKFKTPYNSKPDPGEIFTMPSMTIPDQTMTIQQILERYAKGLPVDVGHNVPMYEGENPEDQTPDLKGLDLSEQHDLIQSQKLKVNQMQNDLIYQNERDKRKKIKKEVEDDFLKQQKAIPAPSAGSNQQSTNNNT